MPPSANPHPKIEWDGKTWSVTLPLEDGKVLNAKWDPAITYVVRIREQDTEHWSFGFQTPVPGCTFTNLKPDTEYEVQLRSRNASGDSPPTFLTIRTNPKGAATNVVPFVSQAVTDGTLRSRDYAVSLPQRPTTRCDSPSHQFDTVSTRPALTVHHDMNQTPDPRDT